MADMHDAITNATSSSSSSPPENDDISLFIRQILPRTASSPSSTASPSILSHKMQSFDPFSHFSLENQHRQLLPPSLLSDPTRISAADLSSCPYVPTNLGSASMGIIGNDFDDYDCENEDGFEGLMEEASAKPTPRNSSKRSRAAEVHNLSEKRRRSRINEKMKALQNLIPNSNKTDKASMLDEAIEYLKQLQLQVQMLTMRNGLSLYPMCLPGVPQPNQLSQMRIGFHEGNGNLKMTSTPPINTETLTNSVFCLPNQCNNLNQPSQPVTNLSNIINSKTSFRLESSTQAQHRAFGLHTCSEEICGECTHFQSLNVDHSETNLGMLKDLHLRVKATSSIPFDAQASGSKDKALDASNHGRS